MRIPLLTVVNNIYKHYSQLTEDNPSHTLNLLHTKKTLFTRPLAFFAKTSTTTCAYCPSDIKNTSIFSSLKTSRHHHRHCLAPLKQHFRSLQTSR
mmetsp:Transcript_30148/g.56040  ORF Transcript_30148/g.56040 Transcript_30148/m.56040 type:complete len:95 (-) Transcript_30148:608-892(-)